MSGQTQRERFWNWANYEDPHDIPAWGDWVGPYDFWLKQGMPPMPEQYQTQGGAFQYMVDLWNFEGAYSAFWGTSRVPVNLSVFPGFTPEILEESETHVIKRMGDGTICKEMKNPNSTLIAQEYLSHALIGPENWKKFRDTQLNPNHPGRYPEESVWAALKEAWKDRDYILTIDGGSFYGNVRNWMGVENISYAFYDHPEWMHEVMDYLADFYIQVLSRALQEVDVDIALFWEDMCFKNGPLISPDMFREFLLKPYQKVTSFLEKNGVKLSFVDCDGNIESFILWREPVVWIRCRYCSNIRRIRYCFGEMWINGSWQNLRWISTGNWRGCVQRWKKAALFLWWIMACRRIFLMTIIATIPPEEKRGSPSVKFPERTK